MKDDSLKPLTFVDLFAGCGGLSLGLSWAGWEGVLAIENDEMAFDTLQFNMMDENGPHHFPHWPTAIPTEPIDVNDLLNEHRESLKELRGDVTLLAGGPPCQGFSVAGARNGEDDRNSLVEAFLEAAKILRPPFLLLENVEGMTRAFESKPRGDKKVSVEEEVQRYLKEELDYVSFSEILDASQFGVPQTRDRLFIFAIDKSFLSEKIGTEFDPYKQTPLFSGNVDSGLEASKLSVFEQMRAEREDFLSSKGLPTEQPVTVGEALRDLATDDMVQSPEYDNFETCTYRSDPGSHFARIMREGVSDREVADSHRFTNHGERVRSRYELIHREADYGRVSREILEKTGTGKHRVVYLDPGEPAPTVTTSPGDFLHFSQPRIVTVREMARLQTFPDDFEFKGRYTINGPRRKHDRARVSQVGNAVPPFLSEAIGRGLKRVIESIRSVQESTEEVV